MERKLALWLAILVVISLVVLGTILYAQWTSSEDDAQTLEAGYFIKYRELIPSQEGDYFYNVTYEILSVNETHVFYRIIAEYNGSTVQTTYDNQTIGLTFFCLDIDAWMAPMQPIFVGKVSFQTEWGSIETDHYRFNMTEWGMGDVHIWLHDGVVFQYQREFSHTDTLIDTNMPEIVGGH